MKKQLLLAFLSYSVGVAALAAPNAVSSLAPLLPQAKAAHLSAEIVKRFHYRPVPLDDGLSERIFDSYLKALDPEHIFFLQADIDRFSVARHDLDDAVEVEDLRIPFAIYNIYQNRVEKRLAYARGLLKDGFDFSIQEAMESSRDKAPWVTTESAVEDIWRKRVKNDWLRLRLAGKDDNAIRDTLAKRYANTLTRAARTNNDDVFQLFMNTFCEAIEPHTNYLGPRAVANYDISMSLSLVGIGATLQERDTYATIRELVPGGPAALSGNLAVGDRIVRVGQASGPMTEVVGWRIDDVVALIRGAAGTTVHLEVLPADAATENSTKTLSLVRNRITFDNQAAKKSVIEVKDGTSVRKIGVLTLPTFYQDSQARSKGDPAYKSATRDMARLLTELNAENVDGVLVDLRNNGGGSLNEAVELTTLFTGPGPVVQIRNSKGDVDIQSSSDGKQGWAGPLGVLVNRGSASASEIFAAAIQDYGRGVIIGEPSFGKGTVQNIFNLDTLAKSKTSEFGELKMTIAQFFRVDGGTTQLRGIVPDVSFPSTSDYTRFGESSYRNALPYTQITPAKYARSTALAPILPALQDMHRIRATQDLEFQALVEDTREAKALRDRPTVSLNETDRRAEYDAQIAKRKQRAELLIAEKSGTDKLPGKASFQDTGLLSGEGSLSAELAAEKALKDARDVWLQEAAHIVGNEASLLGAGGPALLHASNDE